MGCIVIKVTPTHRILEVRHRIRHELPHGIKVLRSAPPHVRHHSRSHPKSHGVREHLCRSIELSHSLLARLGTVFARSIRTAFSGAVRSGALGSFIFAGDTVGRFLALLDEVSAGSWYSDNEGRTYLMRRLRLAIYLTCILRRALDWRGVNGRFFSLPVSAWSSC